MNKNEFLFRLNRQLSGFPEDAAKQTVEYYAEMIDDLVEDGMNEEEAVASLGSVDEIVNNALDGVTLPAIIKEKVRPKKRMSAGAVILIILGFPLWFPLLCAFFVVIAAVFAVLWAMLIAFWAVTLALAAAGVCCVGFGFWVMFHGFFRESLAVGGAGLVCVGVAVLCFFLFKPLTRLTARLCAAVARGLKRLFIR